MPLRSSESISSIRNFGSTTTPLPITGMVSGYSTPLGSNWRAKLSPSTTTVCPALCPPWYRTTTCMSLASRSVSFPLPSSPHWVPTRTVAGSVRSFCRSGGRHEHIAKATQPGHGRYPPARTAGADRSGPNKAPGLRGPSASTVSEHSQRAQSASTVSVRCLLYPGQCQPETAFAKREGGDACFRRVQPWQEGQTSDDCLSRGLLSLRVVFSRVRK